MLYGTLPFDAGLSTTPGRLDRVPVLVVHGDQYNVILGTCLIAPGRTSSTTLAP